MDTKKYVEYVKNPKESTQRGNTGDMDKLLQKHIPDPTGEYSSRRNRTQK